MEKRVYYSPNLLLLIEHKTQDTSEEHNPPDSSSISPFPSYHPQDVLLTAPLLKPYSSIYNVARTTTAFRQGCSISSHHRTILFLCCSSTSTPRNPLPPQETGERKVNYGLSRRTPNTNDSLVNGVVAKHVDFDWGALIDHGPITSIEGTTGVGVPGKIWQWLLKSGISIEEDAQDHFGSELAVKEVEENMCDCWDFVTSNSFGNADCTSSLQFGSYDHEGEQERLLLPDPNLIDIVTPSIRNLDFLNEWREFFQGFHIIIIQVARTLDRRKSHKSQKWSSISSKWTWYERFVQYQCILYRWKALINDFLNSCTWNSIDFA